MYKVGCELIQDLLPLYIDAACSEQSILVIEEHIKECDECREQLNAMRQSMPIVEHHEAILSDAKAIQSLSRTWHKTKLYAWIKGALIAIISCILIIVSYLLLTEWKIVAVPAELIEVSEVYELSDGTISYRLKVMDDYELTNLSQTYDDKGNSYTLGYRSIIRKKRNTSYASYGFHNKLHRMHPEKETELLLKLSNVSGVQGWYYGTEDNRTLIWKKGMETPKASESLEQYWKNEGELVYPEVIMHNDIQIKVD